MRRKYFNISLSVLIVLLFVFSQTTQSQFVAEIYATDGQTTDTVYFGLHPDATNGIDPALGEAELPPIPVVGVFDFRFVDLPGHSTLAGVKKDLRALISGEQTDVFTISLQKGTTGSVTLSWGDLSSYAGTLFLKNHPGFLDPPINVNMLLRNSLTLPASVAETPFKILMVRTTGTPPLAGAWVNLINTTAGKDDRVGFAVKAPNIKEMARCLAIDKDGYIYVTGATTTLTKFDFITVKKHPTTGIHVWTKYYNNAPINKTDRATAIAVDNDGNVYVTGASESGTKFDIVTIKYNSDGDQLWLARYNNSAVNKNDIPYAIAVSSAGQVFVVGETDNGASKIDAVLLAYDAEDGTMLWSKTVDGGLNKVDKAYAVAVDANTGDVVMVGEATTATKFDYLIVKYDMDGNLLWPRYYNGTASKADQAFDVAIDRFGNVYVTGVSDHLVGKLNYVTLKYNESGDLLWTAVYNNELVNKADVAYALALDEENNVYVTGTSDGGATKLDYLTVKYNSDGVQQWVSRRDGGISKADIARGIAVNNNTGFVYVTGSSDQPARKLDILTLKLNMLNGDISWAGRFNGAASKDDVGFNVVVHPVFNYVAVAGNASTANKLDIVVIQGHADTHLPLPITTPDVFADEDGFEDGFRLANNYPNPFNPSTTIEFNIPENSIVTLKVYNLLGQEVATLIDREEMTAGYDQVNFDASGLATGVYIYRLTAQGLESGTTIQLNKKMVLMK